MKGNQMENNKDKKTEKKETPMEFPPKDSPQRYDAPEAKSSINNPNRALPAFNPPVPNRAWTEMRYDLMAPDPVNSIYDLTPEEKADLYMQPKKY